MYLGRGRVSEQEGTLKQTSILDLSNKHDKSLGAILHAQVTYLRLLLDKMRDHRKN